MKLYKNKWEIDFALWNEKQYKDREALHIKWKMDQGQNMIHDNLSSRGLWLYPDEAVPLTQKNPLRFEKKWKLGEALKEKAENNYRNKQNDKEDEKQNKHAKRARE